MVKDLFIKMLELHANAGISSSVYAIEECSELIKELCKDLRNKGRRENIIEESCDVLATVYSLLLAYGVSDEEITSRIEYKFKRGILRMSNGDT